MDELTPPSTKMPTPPSGTPSKVGAVAPHSSQLNRMPSAPQEKPLLFVDIDIGEEQKDRITVLRSDSARDLALRFCQKHGFDYETQCTLEQQLLMKIDKVKTLVDKKAAADQAAVEDSSDLNNSSKRRSLLEKNLQVV